MTRNGGLDLIRVAAASAVFFYHLRVFAGIDLLGPVAQHGNLAVPAFFALSGYLVYRPFAHRQVEPVAYLIRRAARILPACVAATTLVGLLFPWSAAAGLSRALWSLVIELEFYLALPLLARLVAGREIVAIGLLAAASYGFALTVPELTVQTLVPYSPAFFWCFAAGMAVAILERDRPGWLQPRFLLPFGGALALAAMEVGGDVWTDLLPALATATLIAGLIGWRAASPQLTFAADVSYPFYLWHVPMIALLTTILSGPALAVLAFASTAAVSTASVVLLERPVQRWAKGRGPRPSDKHPAVPSGRALAREATR
jgi:peptidoglycan/LPS O-acetylase OafA/YrhL